MQVQQTCECGKQCNCSGGCQQQQSVDTIAIQKKPAPKKFINQIPEQILNNPLLNEAIQVLPKNYNLEIHQSIWRINKIKQETGKQNPRICLQFPEGLMMFACLISDILTAFTDCETIIMGDVTYGACCIDDLTARDLKADFLIHYGHSCLVPITDTCTKVLYVFVEIACDLDHFTQTVELNIPEQIQKIYLMGTIQFMTVMYEFKSIMEQAGYVNIIIPQEKPRCSGEVLGCTSPQLPVDEDPKNNLILFVCDGRFHMEATMIANPKFQYFQYNPYNQELTIQKYQHQLMKEIRYQEVKQSQEVKKRVCFILGTLGRQGSPEILKRMEDVLKEKGVDYLVMLVSQVNFEQLTLFAEQVDFFVQIACPRLSIDWGAAFKIPLLNPYEFFVAMKKIDWKEVYPMDFYADNGGPWTNYFGKKEESKKQRTTKLKYQEKTEVPTKSE